MTKPQTDRDRALMAEARVAQLEAELAEYRRMERGHSFTSLDEVRLQKLMGHGGARVKIVLALMSAGLESRGLDHAGMIDAVWGLGEIPDCSRNIINIQICRARKDLAAIGLADCIVHHRPGITYYMPKHYARRLSAMIDAVKL